MKLLGAGVVVAWRPGDRRAGRFSGSVLVRARRAGNEARSVRVSTWAAGDRGRSRRRPGARGPRALCASSARSGGGAPPRRPVRRTRRPGWSAHRERRPHVLHLGHHRDRTGVASGRADEVPGPAHRWGRTDTPRRACPRRALRGRQPRPRRRGTTRALPRHARGRSARTDPGHAGHADRARDDRR